MCLNSVQIERGVTYSRPNPGTGMPSQERFRARPMWACLEPCPVSKITSFGLDSSRSRKSVFVLVYIVFFRNIRDSTTNREFPQELFWMTLRNRGRQSNLWRQTGQPEMTPSVAFRVKLHVSLFCECSRPLAAGLSLLTSAPGASSPERGRRIGNSVSCPSEPPTFNYQPSTTSWPAHHARCLDVRALADSSLSAMKRVAWLTTFRVVRGTRNSLKSKV